MTSWEEYSNLSKSLTAMKLNISLNMGGLTGLSALEAVYDISAVQFLECGYILVGVVVDCEHE